MKSNELRIRNWVEFEGGNFQITSVDDDTPNGWYGRIRGDRTEYNLSNFKPIPLTEEWLIRLGFETKNAHKGLFKDCWFLCKSNLRSDAFFFGEFMQGTYCEIEYVHQLQNLYFALTGEELKALDK